MNQEIQDPSEVDAQKKSRFKTAKISSGLKNIRSSLTEEQLRLNNPNQEQRPSSWLRSLITSQNNSSGILFKFITIDNSQDFQLIVNEVKNLTFSRLFLAKKGGFLSLRHNLVRNITSS